MSPNQLVALAVRLFAIWLGIYLLLAVPTYFIQLRKFDEPILTAFLVLVAIATVVGVLLLWSFPLTVARNLLPSTSVASSDDASADAWLAVGCGLLGLWILAGIFPRLAQYLFLWFYSRRTEMDIGENFVANVIYNLVEAATGIWLLLGARGARKIIWWARSGRIVSH